jgi:hypothetical protein
LINVSRSHVFILKRAQEICPTSAYLLKPATGQLKSRGPDSAAQNTLADDHPADEQRRFLQLDDQREI